MNNIESLDFASPEQLLGFFSHIEHEVGRLEGIIQGLIELKPEELKGIIERKGLTPKESYLFEQFLPLLGDLNGICNYVKEKKDSGLNLVRVEELRDKIHLLFDANTVHKGEPLDAVVARHAEVKKRMANYARKNKKNR